MLGGVTLLRTCAASPSALLRSAIILLASNGVAGAGVARAAGTGDSSAGAGLVLARRSTFLLRALLLLRRLALALGFFTSLVGGATDAGVAAAGVGAAGEDAMGAAAGLACFAGTRASAMRAARSRPGVFSGTASD